MTKPANKRPAKVATKVSKQRSRKATAAKPAAADRPLASAKTAAPNDRKSASENSSKQSLVVEMLRSPTGTTIAAVMKATGWQQHSVRGFFAGVVQKKLRLKLNSEKIDGNRVYRIVGAGSARSNSRRPSRRSA